MQEPEPLCAPLQVPLIVAFATAAPVLSTTRIVIVALHFPPEWLWVTASRSATCIEELPAGVFVAVGNGVFVAVDSGVFVAVGNEVLVAVGNGVLVASTGSLAT